MYYTCDERAKEFARYIIDNNATVRKTAGEFKISKSTVHKDVSYRLKSIDYELYKKVKAVLDKNLEERHIRGGIATKRHRMTAMLFFRNLRIHKIIKAALKGSFYLHYNAFLAVSTSAANEFMSETAISASIFLSRVTPAFLRPFINCE